jgi:hypothetical protein
VLVAGDDAEPVFDNAVAAFERWLAALGVAAGAIHRLSARPPPPQQSGNAAAAVVVEPAAGRHILDRIASLQPRTGEGCLVFITSHGQASEGIWLAYSSGFLRADELARALSAGCAAAPSVVILSSCYSGGFAQGVMRAPNRIILTASRADRPSFGCQADRTYTVFDECLLAALPRVSTWRAVYDTSKRCVQAREKRLQVRPSEPQASFGTAVRDLAVR